MRRMKLRHVAALALVGWVIVVQHQQPQGVYLLPGFLFVPPTTEYAKRSDCEKVAAEYQKEVSPDTLLKCVEKRKSN